MNPSEMPCIRLVLIAPGVFAGEELVWHDGFRVFAAFIVCGAGLIVFTFWQHSYLSDEGVQGSRRHTVNFGNEVPRWETE